MKYLYCLICAIIVITVYFVSVCGQDILSLDNDEDNLDKRKIFKSDKLYTLHVQKLREVNGLKTHNLKDAEPSRLRKPLLYINNPVESKMPNAYLTIDQFKNSMLERVQKQKRDFQKFTKNKLLINTNKKFKPFKHDIIIINRGNTKYEKRYTNPTLKTRPPYEVLFGDNDMYEMPIDSFTNEIIPSIDNTLSQSHDKSFDVSDETDFSQTTADVTTTTQTMTTTLNETTTTIENRLSDVEGSITEGYKNTDIAETTVTDEPSTDTIDDETTTDMILNETTTELVIDLNKTTIGTETESINENSTETTMDDNTTPTIFYETSTETVVDEMKETTDTVEDETTTESNKDEEVTETIEDKETTEAIVDKTTTSPEIVTTTKGPPERTKRPRPFVFMGDS